jgi:hypothetical protein
MRKKSYLVPFILVGVFEKTFSSPLRSPKKEAYLMFTHMSLCTTQWSNVKQHEFAGWCEACILGVNLAPGGAL